MPHPSVNISVRVALGFMALRLVLFFVNADFPYQEEVFLFLLFLGLIILSIYAVWPRNKIFLFKEDVLISLRITLVFSVAMVIFLLGYYEFVDTNAFPNYRDARIDLILEMNPDLTKKEILEKTSPAINLKVGSVLLMIVSVVLSFFYSIFFSALKRLIIK